MRIKKPPKSGSLYHNYKGFFSVILMALVDAEYRFRWVDIGTEGSCSDAQIFNISELRNKIEDGSVGFPEAEPIEPDGPDIPYFILADDAFALKTWLMKPYPLKGKGRTRLPTTGSPEEGGLWRMPLASCLRDSVS